MEDKKYLQAKQIMDKIDKIDELDAMIEKSHHALTYECRTALHDLLIQEQTSLYNQFNAL